MGLDAFDDNGKTPPALTLTKLGKKPLKDLASLFHVARTCDSTDPRDRIYALLGLLSNADELGLFVDYEKTTQQLFVEVTIRAITTYNHLDVLSEKRFMPNTSPPPSSSVSTWVPDMLVNSKSSSFAHWRGKSKLAFSESPVATFTCLDFINLNRYSLKLRVLPIDTISKRLSGCVRHESPDKYNVLLYRGSSRWPADMNTKSFVEEAGLIQGDDRLDDKVKAFSVDRKFMKTSRSYAICADPVAVEDVVFAIYGATVPFVLRIDRNTGYYKFLGECYLHVFGNSSSGDDYNQLLGMYAGDFVQMPSDGDLEELNGSSSRVRPASDMESRDSKESIESNLPWIEITVI
ncbi:hypothetical protein M441DRAFT_58525 [Neofusicoccum parvum]|nr:hypothetical protein M441DRAFT_58525 [Neofusicoccum parvum]